MFREIHYRWEYNLDASPEKLWPFVADTNRFNRDTGLPSLEANNEEPALAGRKRVRLSAFGIAVEWEEQPFEWVEPSRFGVTRRYLKGPLAELRVLAELSPLPEGRTKLVYQVWALPKSLLGVLAARLQIGMISAPRFRRAYEKYARLAAASQSPVVTTSRPALKAPASARLNAMRERLMSQGIAENIATALVNLVEQGDVVDLARIRPYALADSWNEPRRAVLEACFWATRAGLLDLQWDLICPMCRGPQESSSSLREIQSQVHCEGCRIDFRVSFDRFVEVTFRPNAGVRRVDSETFCIGSPQKTPHVVVQQLLPAGSDRALALPLEVGRYRIRAAGLPGEQLMRVSADGAATALVTASGDGWASHEIDVAPRSTLRLENKTGAEHLFLVERTSWSDQAATAAEVTALQIFRDLFSTEALRPGEQISVGTLTVLFTDLRNSTKLYREIGDATAFGRVMNHFDILRQAIAAEDGALVKTIGDAVMAVFREPEAALRAMVKAQALLASPVDGSEPLTLKAGLHTGPCIAVTLNDRLDYFGSTVNMAARLEGLSTGNDVIISRAVYDDPEVREMLESPHGKLAAERFEIPLKGFDAEQFELWRVRLR